MIRRLCYTNLSGEEAVIGLYFLLDQQEKKYKIHSSVQFLFKKTTGSNRTKVARKLASFLGTTSCIQNTFINLESAKSYREENVFISSPKGVHSSRERVHQLL